MKISKRASLPRRQEILIQALAILLSLAFAGIVILILGYNPIEVYYKIVEGSVGTGLRLVQTINKAIPWVIVSMGILVAFKMKFWNIGGEGQIMMGAFGASLVALNLPEELPGFVMLTAMATVSILCGALWAFIAMVLGLGVSAWGGWTGTASLPRYREREVVTTLSGACPVRWLGQICPSLSNQNSVICVSSSPLPGMGSPMITSKAEMRSLATISSRSLPTA